MSEELFQRVTAVKSEVLASVSDHHGAMELTFRNAADVTKKVAELAQQLRACADLGQAEERGSAEWTRLTAQLQHSEAVVGVLQQLTAVRDALAAFDAALDASSYGDAAAAVVALRQLEAALPAEPAEAADAKALRLVRRQCRQRRARLVERLDQLLLLAVEIEPRALRVSQSLNGTFGHMHLARPVSLQSVVAALEALGLLDERMAAVGARLREHLIDPLCSDPGLTPEAAVDGDCSTLLCAPKPSQRTTVTSSQLTKRVLAVLLFFRQALPSAAAVAALGRAMWPGADGLAALLTAALRNAIPEDGGAALEAYIEKATAEAQRVEEQLRSIGFTGDDDSTLTDFLGDSRLHHARKRRVQLLLRARDAFKDEYHNTTTVSGEDVGDGLPFESRTVTRASFQLLEMARSTLQEAAAAASCSPESAHTLYSTTRHMFELFRAVVPTIHADALASDSLHARTAILFYNDTCFLAHAMTTLPLQVRAELPTATFADLISPLRNLGERHLVGHVTVQSALLARLAGEVPAFDALDSPDALDKIERALARLLSRVRGVAAAWRPLLPASTLQRMLLELVSAALDPLTARVQALQSIGADEGAQLHRLLSAVLPVRELLAQEAPALERFAAVTQLLDDRLATIDARVDAGELSALAPGEVAALLCAVFSETPARAALLAKLAAAP